MIALDNNIEQLLGWLYKDKQYSGETHYTYIRVYYNKSAYIFLYRILS